MVWWTDHWRQCYATPALGCAGHLKMVASGGSRLMVGVGDAGGQSSERSERYKKSEISNILC